MIKIYRGEILHFLADPAKVALEESYQHFEDGALVIENGLVKELGEAKKCFLNIQIQK